jgi:hypothetical protein
MNQRLCGRTNTRAVKRTSSVRKPGYAAQMGASPFRRKTRRLRAVGLSPTRSRIRIAQPTIGCPELDSVNAMLGTESTLEKITVR